MMIEFVYDSKKSDWLRKHRGIGFEEIIEYIEGGWALGVVPHPNQKAHPKQWVYEVTVDGYVFEVPFYISSRSAPQRLTLLFIVE